MFAVVVFLLCALQSLIVAIVADFVVVCVHVFIGVVVFLGVFFVVFPFGCV